MPCVPFGNGFICTGRRRAARCAYCKAPHTRLCDYPTERGRKCDRKLCSAHAARVAHGVDLCPEHAAGNLPSTGLVVCTGSVHHHCDDPDALDVTVMTGGARGAPFAPSLALFQAAKRDLRTHSVQRAQASVLLANAARTLCEDDPSWAEVRRRAAEAIAEADAADESTWLRYRRGFLAEMLVSSGRPIPEGWAPDVGGARDRGAQPHVSAWKAELARTRRVYLCYCAGRARCHRGLLVEILVRLGASDGGELPVPAKTDAQVDLFDERERG